MLEWKKTSEELPKECHIVWGKINYDGMDSFVVLTLVEGEWVTDATISEVYGIDGHSKIHEDYIPFEWAYPDLPD